MNSCCSARSLLFLQRWVCEIVFVCVCCALCVAVCGGDQERASLNVPARRRLLCASTQSKSSLCTLRAAAHKKRNAQPGRCGAGIDIIIVGAISLIVYTCFECIIVFLTCLQKVRVVWWMGCEKICRSKNGRGCKRALKSERVGVEML